LLLQNQNVLYIFNLLGSLFNLPEYSHFAIATLFEFYPLMTTAPNVIMTTAPNIIQLTINCMDNAMLCWTKK